MADVDQPITLSVIVPALNEAENLEACVREAVQALSAQLTYEILIFNDGSSDATGAVAQALMNEFPSIRVFHNPATRGLGYNYTRGVELARGTYVMMVPGDNELRFASLGPALEMLGSHDIIIPYIANPKVRPFSRRILSRLFTGFLNLMFGLKVKYFNGPCIHRTQLLRQFPIETTGFAYMAQTLVRLLKKANATYRQVPMELRARTHGSSKAFAPRNVLSVGQTLFSLVREIYFSKNSYALVQKEKLT